MAPGGDESRQWAVLLGLKDDVAVIRACLMGQMQPDGSYREGLLAEVDRLRLRVMALEEAAVGRLKLWHAVLIGCVPALLTFALMQIAAHAAGR